MPTRRLTYVETTVNYRDERLAFIIFGTIGAVGTEIFLITGAIGAAISGDVEAAAVVGSLSALMPAALGISIHSFNSLINRLENRMMQNKGN